MIKQTGNKKIMLGMSGGVDSAAAALLLTEAGYSVCGVTLLLTPDNEEQRQAVTDAAAVCAALGIEHRAVDMRALFKQRVIDCFTAEYMAGRTPNPCVECNRYIKLGAMLDLALSEGFDAVATGHYARIAREPDGEYAIYRSACGKDQSYVLWQTPRDRLDKIILPLADMDKSELRERVKSAGLPVFSKPDSQDICFIPDGDYAGYIRRMTGVTDTEGDFVDCAGNVIGRHKGILHYTIGQRKGLGGGFKHPMFVSEIIPAANTIVLGENGCQYKQNFICNNINMILSGGERLLTGISVKPRYNAPAAAADVSISDDGTTATVHYHQPQRSLTPGQSAVFYMGDRLIGGGKIAGVID